MRIHAAVQVLAQRRRSGTQGPLLGDDCRPQDIDAAFAIQREVMAALGTTAGAWKCGLPQGERLTAAPIHAGTIIDASPCPVWTREGMVRIEPELAFVLGHDLPPRAEPYTPAEIDAAIAQVHLALELIDTRYAGPDKPTYFDALADGLVNQGLFLGPAVNKAAAFAAATIDIDYHQADGTVQNLQGRHPAGPPAAPLHWLAEWLRQKGDGLHAGQAVITGSYAGTLAVPPGQPLIFQYRGLSELRVTFTSNKQNHVSF